MSKIKITMDKEGTYLSGETISGVVEWTPKSSRRPKPVRVNLLYKTKGRGTRDVVIVDSLELPEDVGCAAFSFPLSGHPPSFSGELVSVYWYIEAVHASAKESDRYGFIVSATGKVLELARIKRRKLSKFRLSLRR